MAELAQTPVQKYLDVIAAYEADFKKWEARNKKILKRYRDDERSASASDADTAKFNILWSNVQTLVPAVYARMPKADVSRRFADNDPVGRVASLLLERTLDYEIEHYSDFRNTMHHCVEDRFLGGRGVSWVRYDPHIAAQEVEITEDVPEPEDQTAGEEPQEQIEYECTPTDYVHWKDFGHSVARTWEEVTIGWRWVYMTKEALTKRFGADIAKKVPLDSGPDKLDKTARSEKLANDRAKICELWDKETGNAVWLSKHLPDLIDERPDPLELENFFPFPKPLYATTTSDNLVPVPDFVLYQDQAKDLDILSDRIDGLIKALRVRGVYDASQPALQRLLTEGDNNTLVGVDKWQGFMEKNGLKGSIDLIPVEVFANTLIQCYQAQANIKSTIYEITGISDIVRGQGAASETATAQQIKGQYVGLRLRSMQEAVAMFASELLKIKAQIICGKYQDKTILAYAAADQLSDADKAVIPAAMQLLRGNPLRSFRIDVEADSLVQIDEAQLKQDRLEFLNATSNFLREAVPAGQQVPELAPAIIAMIQFGVAGFKQARQIEGTLDTALQALQAKAAQMAANPQPHPDQIKAQADQQQAQMKAQSDAQAAQLQAQSDAQVANIRAQADMQMEQLRAHTQTQIEQMRAQNEMQIKARDLEMTQAFDRWKAELDAATKIQVATISADPETASSMVEQYTGSKILADLGNQLQGHMDQQSANHKEMADKMHSVTEALMAPKRIIRGPDGRAVGTAPILQSQGNAAPAQA